jgi:hypothetical protein
MAGLAQDSVPQNGNAIAAILADHAERFPSSVNSFFFSASNRFPFQTTSRCKLQFRHALMSPISPLSTVLATLTSQRWLAPALLC